MSVKSFNSESSANMSNEITSCTPSSGGYYKGEEREPKEMQRWIKSVSSVLDKVTRSNKISKCYKQRFKRETTSPFFSPDIPEVSVEDYWFRIIKYTNLEESSLISALIYIDRWSLVGNVLLNENNVHRILFSSILASIKYNEDRIYAMDYYADIAGIGVKEWIAWENELLTKLKFDLYIKDALFETYVNYWNSQN